MTDDLRERLRGAADYLEIRGITECNPKAVLWEAANALDAKDARIAELERDNAKLEKWLREDNAQHGYDVLEVVRHAEIAEAKCEQLRDALQEARDTLRDDRIGTTRMDDPNLYQRIRAAADKADAALNIDRQDDNTTA